MAKPRMIGMNKTFIPNSKVDQRSKRFNRKEMKRNERQHHVYSSVCADGSGSCGLGLSDLGMERCEKEK